MLWIESASECRSHFTKMKKETLTNIRLSKPKTRPKIKPKPVTLFHPLTLGRTSNPPSKASYASITNPEVILNPNAKSFVDAIAGPLESSIWEKLVSIFHGKPVIHFSAAEI